MNMLIYVKKTIFQALQTKQQNFTVHKYTSNNLNYEIIITKSYDAFIYAKCLNSTEPNQDSLANKIKYR